MITIGNYAEWKLVLVLSFYYLFLNIGAILLENSQRPRIFPKQHELIAVANSDLDLRCEGTHPVTWTLPPSIDNDETWSHAELTNSSTPDDEFQIGSILRISNISYTDTGYYYCHYSEIDDVENPFYSTSIYVYVKDEEHLSVNGENGLFLSGVESSIILIPCKPTFPEVNVTLYHNYDPLETSYNSYDPKAGFKAYLDSIHDFFHCAFSYFDKTEEEEVNLKFLSKSTSVDKPSIHTDKGEHVLENEDLTLTCEVIVDQSTMFELNWTIPAKSGLMTGRISISNTTVSNDNNSHGLIGKSVLHVNTLVEDDEGFYYCNVKDHLNNVNNNSIFVQVHEKGFGFINFTEDFNILTTNFTIGQDPNFVKYKINVHAYPPVQLNWYDNKNEVILSGWADDINFHHKFSITTDPRYTTLTVQDISLTDFGNYTLKAVNEIMEKEISLKLQVFDKPNVEINTSNIDYIMVNETIVIQCYILAYPEPEISWSFRSCDNCSSIFLNDSFVVIDQIDNINYTSKLEYKFMQSGYLTCHANNSLGSHQHVVPVTLSDVQNGFGILLEKTYKTVAVGDSLMLSCAAKKSNFSQEFNWTKVPPFHHGEVSFEKSTTQFSNVLTMRIENVTQNNYGKYTCDAFHKHIIDEDNFDFINEKLSQDINVIVLNTSAPKIVNSNMNGSEFKLLLGQPLDLFCEVDGVPSPDVIWLKDSRIFHHNESNNRITVRENLRFHRYHLVFNFTQLEDEGVYECLATNRVGNNSGLSTLIIKNKLVIDYTLLGLISGVFAMIFVLLSTILYRKCRKEKKLKRELKIAGLTNFEKGQLESLNPDLTVDEQADLLPYDKKKWEFPSHRLRLGKQLGSGAFGVVLKADAYGILPEESKTTVAVKMVKGITDHCYIKALVSELKIMGHLGKHVNVVNLLGACTENVLKRELMVIVEYCRYGNIRNFLIKNRDNFVNQLNSETGKFDYEIVLSEHVSNTKIPRRYSSFRKSTRNGSMNYDNTNSNMTATTYLSFSSAENSKNSRNSDEDITFSSTNYRGDYKKGDIGAIYSRNLLFWSFQIANGMDYLASRKVLHGDLAARNILLAADNIVKICDFGLAKSVYKNDNYKKEGNGPLPLKWMAIESIRDRVFSVQSDVWSFGILLWEIFSLANTPYPEKEVDGQFYNDLLNGYRMGKPVYANDELYEIMKECWRTKPVTRPSFFELVEKLKQTVHVTDLKTYAEISDFILNEKNTENVSSPDYLEMLKSPDCRDNNEPYMIVKNFSNDINGNIFKENSESNLEMLPLMLNGSHNNVPQVDIENGNKPNKLTTTTYHRPLAVVNPTYMSTFGKGPKHKKDAISRRSYIVYGNRGKYDVNDGNDDDAKLLYVNNQTKDWEKFFR